MSENSMADCQIFDNHNCELGEGPLWHPKLGVLFWFDITNSTMYMSDSGETYSWVFDQNVSAAAWVDKETLLIIGERDLMHFDIASGGRQTIAQIEADNVITRSNDSRADRQNGFWIGTMGKKVEKEAGAIYRYYRGEVRQLHDNISISNAICFSPDGTMAYFTDTLLNIVYKQMLDVETGWPVSEPEPFLDFTEGRRAGGFDGAIVDADGNMWIAFWGEGLVQGFSSDGAPLETYMCSSPHTTCPAMGGDRFTTLYVTSAMQGLDEEARAKYPTAGQVFSFQTNIRGLPEPNVII